MIFPGDPTLEPFFKVWFQTGQLACRYTSVLIVYEGDEDAVATAHSDGRAVRVCVVDFCNYVQGCGELDDNFGVGLDRMVEMLSDIVHGEC